MTRSLRQGDGTWLDLLRPISEADAWFASHFAPESEVLRRVSVRLIHDDEKALYDQLLQKRHYLHNAILAGQNLRYIAELDGNGWPCSPSALRRSTSRGASAGSVGRRANDPAACSSW